MTPDTAKGYLKEDFTSLFRRYISKSDIEILKRDLRSEILNPPRAP
jgi:hypothetical protein